MQHSAHTTKDDESQNKLKYFFSPKDMIPYAPVNASTMILDTCCASSSLCWTLSAMCLAAATVKKKVEEKMFYIGILWKTKYK